jgi:NADH-quinone oxidoreductase subunit N
MGNSVTLILPAIVVAATALVVLLVDAFLPASRRGLTAWVAAAGLVASMAVAAGQWIKLRGGVHLFERHAAAGFGQMVGLDKYAVFFVILFGAVGLLAILLSDGYLVAHRSARGEFYALLLLVITGMIGMAVSTDVIALFISFELMSLPTYVLAGWSRRDPRSGEAALKYFINGAFSSAILLFGLALLYGLTGATNYVGIAAGLAHLPGRDAAGVAALVLVIAGFGFKVSAVPFHAWAPDVYEGAPTPVTAFMSVGVKAGAFAGFLKLFVVAAAPQWRTWADVLIVIAVITMVVGNVLALPQRNLKRLFAYSSIAHAGYLLLGLIAVGRSGTTDGSSAVLVYLGAYTFMNIGAFGMLVYLRNRRAFGYTLDEVAGLGRSHPVASLGLALFMLSLTGIPPTAGFWGKFYLFTAVVNAHLTWLAVVAVVMSSVSAYYYLRVVWYMYFHEAPAAAEEAGVAATGVPLPAPGAASLAAVPEVGTSAALWVAAAGVLFIGVYPGPLLWAAQGAVRLIVGG